MPLTSTGKIAHGAVGSQVIDDTVGGAAPSIPPSEVILDVRQLVRSLAPAAADLADDASFFDSGAVDSLAFLSILREIEHRYAVSLLSDGTMLVDLGSIAEIAGHIARHRQAAAADVR